MATKPIDSDLIFDLPSVAQPALRPDGAAVAYVRSQVDREAMEGRSHIELAPFGGGKARTLTSGESDRSPLWSPDGLTLAFLRRPPGEDAGGKPGPSQVRPSQLWLLPGDGGEARKLTAIRWGVLGMTWAPDGASLICACDVDPDAPPEDDDGAIPRVREVRRVYYRADTIGWRGDAHRQLFHVDATTGEARQLTRGDHDCALPAFSPDGETLAYVSSDRSPTRTRKQRGSELCLMAAGGGRVRVLVRRMAIGQLAWSPDGSEIAFVGNKLDVVREGAELHPYSYLYVANVKSGALRRITDDRIDPQGGFFPVSDPPRSHGRAAASSSPPTHAPPPASTALPPRAAACASSATPPR